MNIFKKIWSFLKPEPVYQLTTKGKLFLNFYSREENKHLDFDTAIYEFEEYYKILMNSFRRN